MTHGLHNRNLFLMGGMQAHHIGVTTMKRLDQSSLLFLIKHPEIDMSGPGGSNLGLRGGRRVPVFQRAS
jgi:hypothetical protein